MRNAYLIHKIILACDKLAQIHRISLFSNHSDLDKPSPRPRFIELRLTIRLTSIVTQWWTAYWVTINHNYLWNRALIYHFVITTYLPLTPPLCIILLILWSISTDTCMKRLATLLWNINIIIQESLLYLVWFLSIFCRVWNKMQISWGRRGTDWTARFSIWDATWRKTKRTMGRG